MRLSKKDWSLHHGEDILVSGIPSFVLEFTIGVMPVGAFQPVFYLLLSRFHGIFSQAIFWKGCCLKMLEEKMKALYGITLGKAA